MIDVLVLASLIVFSTCDATTDDYYDYDEEAQWGPVKCPKGQLREEFIDMYFVRFLDRNYRPQLLAGKQMNGKTGKTLPKGKSMTELEWSCDLEADAIKALESFPEEAPKPKHENRTGLFRKWDGSSVEPDLVSVMYQWMDQIKHHAVTYNEGDQAIRYHDTDAVNLREYLNLVRWDVTEIGCASVSKTENGQHKLRAYCLIDRSPLKEGDVVYSVGNGGCPKDPCPDGFTCSLFGMCKKTQ